MVAHVIFFKTELEGPHEVARITFDGDDLSVEGNEKLLNVFKTGIDGEGAEAIQKAMRLAPERFDGAYLRAEYVEGVTEGGPGSGNWGHKGIPVQRGGSAPRSGITYGSGLQDGINVKAELTEEDKEYISEQIADWGGARGAMADEAYKSAKNYTESELMVSIQDGKIVGIGSFEAYGREKVFGLEYMATRESGHGLSMMAAAADEALDRDMGMGWLATIDAAGFYDHIGFGDFHAPGKRLYTVGIDDLKAWRAGAEGKLSEYSAESAKEHEPEDGVFAAGLPEGALSEGGPGSGHHGHRGIPGYRGGSMAPGAIQFGPGQETYKLEPHLQAYCEKRGEEFMDKLTGDEGHAVISYSTDGHYSMNNCLRKGRDCDEGKYYVDDLTSALDKSTVPEDTVVYRQIQASVIEDMMKQGTVKDKGFCSTTHNLTWASQVGSSKQPTICEIRVPAGTKGGYLQKFSPFEEEAELLLQRGTQFRFTGVIEKMAPGRKTPFKVAQFEVVGQDEVAGQKFNA